MEEMTKREKHLLLQHNECPDCHGITFLEGPHGGLNVNIKCKTCGSKFNVCPPIAERISRLSPFKVKKLIGNLENGFRAVYQDIEGELEIEADHRYLVEPTTEDEAEIYRVFPQLKQWQP